MKNISAIIITKNEEKNISACLERLMWCDEIIVLDCGSIDRTVETAKQFTKNVYVEPWQGYAKQKNSAIKKASGKWILWIDADERISKEAENEIKHIVSSSPKHTAFRIPRRFFFLGKRLKFGGVGTDHPIRLFINNGINFDENKLVHEKLKINGGIGKLKSHIDHLSYYSISQYFIKLNEYTTLSAEEMYKKEKRYNNFFLIKPFFELFDRLILKGAFLDGARGIAFACLSSFSVMIKYLKLKELYNGKNI